MKVIYDGGKKNSHNSFNAAIPF